MPHTPAVLVVLLLLFLVQNDASWDPDIRLSNTANDIFGSGIASAGTYVHVVYAPGITYRRSSANGATWESERVLDTNGVLHLTDPMWADGSDIWIIYLRDILYVTDWCCSRENGDIYILHSSDNGTTWDAPRQLTSSRAAFRVSIVLSENKLHIVWMDYRRGTWDTYYLRSPDRGVIWDPEKLLANGTGPKFGAERPQIAAKGSGVHVTIWDDRGSNPSCWAGPTFNFPVCPDTYYVGSLDGGLTWGPIIPVNYSANAFAGRNDIAISGANSIIINFNRGLPGLNDSNPFMWVVRSPNGGNTWLPAVQLTNNTGTADHGAIIGDGNSVYLTWHDSRDGPLAIWYISSEDEGVTWLPQQKLSSPNSTAEASTPLISTTPLYVHVIWLDKRANGNYQIYYRRGVRPTITTSATTAASATTTTAMTTATTTTATTAATTTTATTTTATTTTATTAATTTTATTAATTTAATTTSASATTMASISIILFVLLCG